MSNRLEEHGHSGTPDRPRTSYLAEGPGKLLYCKLSMSRGCPLSSPSCSCAFKAWGWGAHSIFLTPCSSSWKVCRLALPGLSAYTLNLPFRIDGADPCKWYQTLEMLPNVCETAPIGPSSLDRRRSEGTSAFCQFQHTLIVCHSVN